MVVALSVAVLLAVGSSIGWFARRSYGRTQDWSRGMNERRGVNRSTSEEEIEGALRRVHVLQFEDAAKASHLRAVAK